MHKRLFPTTITILLNLALTSCAEFRDKPLNPADSAAQLEQRDLSSPALRAFIENGRRQEIDWPLPAWNIDNLSLAAIFYHPDMAVARALADATTATNITAAQRPNPTLNTAPSYLTHLASAVLPWYEVSTLNIPIETAGKRGFRMQKSAHLSDAARFRLSDTAWQVRGRLRLALLETFIATEAERLLQQQLGIQQEISERLEQEFSVGEITRPELLRVQLTLNQMQINFSSAQKRKAESRVMLAGAIGLPVAALTGIVIDFSGFAQAPVFADLPLSSLKKIALQQRPDVLAALAEYAAAQSALQLEIANQYPNIQANPGYAWETGENLWSLGATVQLPLFHQNQGAIAEAEAKREEMAQRFEALQMRVIGDIDRAQAGLAAVLAKRQLADKQMEIQQDNLLAAQALLNAGDTDRLSLLATQLESSIAKRARLDVLGENQQALNALEDSLRYPLASSLTTTDITTAATGK